jgi:hypothetical protein
VKLDHSSDILLHAATIPTPRRVDLGMAQAPVNAPDDGENITADLKLVVMEEGTMKILEDVQLKVIL